MLQTNDKIKDYGISDKTFFSILGLFITVFLILTFSRNFAIIRIILRSINAIHKKMIESMLRSKIQFFDTTQSGKIITRFSKDVASIDSGLIFQIIFCTYGLFKVGIILLSLVVINPWLFIPLIISLILFRMLMNFT